MTKQRRGGASTTQAYHRTCRRVVAFSNSPSDRCPGGTEKIFDDEAPRARVLFVRPTPRGGTFVRAVRRAFTRRRYRYCAPRGRTLAYDSAPEKVESREVSHRHRTRSASS